MSGNCFIVHCDDGPTMETVALPALSFVPDMLRVWIHVTEGGAIQFLRQLDGCEQENAGTLRSEQLPHWIKEYFTCVQIRGHSLKAAASFSVDYSAATLPTRLAVESASDMGHVWELA